MLVKWQELVQRRVGRILVQATVNGCTTDTFNKGHPHTLLCLDKVVFPPELKAIEIDTAFKGLGWRLALVAIVSEVSLDIPYDCAKLFETDITKSKIVVTLITKTLKIIK